MPTMVDKHCGVPDSVHVYVLLVRTWGVSLAEIN